MGIPPFPQKKAERMGHGSLQQKAECQPSNRGTVPHPFRRFYREMGGKLAHY